MNPNIAKSLVLDALYQVLDNWVFRILAVLTLLPILVVTVVQFGNEEVSFLFGWQSWRYDSFMGGVGAGAGGPDGMRVLMIEGILKLLFDQVAGGLGVLFCIAATAFFVPRMIEKGAADVLFHKPTSRLLLYMSRYLAGLIFVGVLSTIMVVGVYLGLLVMSGYNDPGILWAIPSLLYLFGIIHTVSMVIAVPTRSTVAAILLTVLFFFGNGCLHQGWQIRELYKMSEGQGMMAQARGTEAEEEGAATEAGEEAAEGGMSFTGALFFTLDMLHYTLPKTGDAGVMASKLRRATSAGPAFLDEDTKLEVVRLPPGFTLQEPSAPGMGARSDDWRELLGDRRLAATGDTGSGIELWSRAKTKTEVTSRNGKVRQRTETLRDAADRFEALLASHPECTDVERFEARPSEYGGGDLVAYEGDSPPGADSPPPDDLDPDEPALSLDNECFSWTENGLTSRAALVRAGNRSYTILHRTPEVANAKPEFKTLCGEVRMNTRPEEDWYAKRFTMSAPLGYNILYSVGSSIAFAVVMLLLGWWRLSKIDF